MAIRNIITEKNETLRKKSRPVEEFNKKLWDLLDDMAQTMYKAEGVGLAAVQVGILRQVIVVDIGEGLIELINPQIVEQKGESVDTEGCLSCPGEYGKVKRPNYVKVKAFDRVGHPIEIEARDFLARAFCHEIDHLSGVIFKDSAIEMVDVK